MSGLLIFLAVLSVLVIAHEFGHFVFARLFGVKVERFSIGFGPKIATFKSPRTEYCISAIPLGGYVKMAGESPEEAATADAKESFLAKTVGARFWIIFAGPALNYILAFVLFSSVFFIGNPQVTSRIGQVLEGFPAREAGLLPGDRITSVNGQSVRYWEEVTPIIHRSMQGEITLTVERGGQSLPFRMAPRIRETKNLFGQKVKVAQVGIAPAGEVVKIRYPFLESLGKGGRKLLEFTAVTFRALWGMITGSMPVRESLTGPIGIFFVTKEASKLGFVYLLQVMALLSASLAIFNVLPIPVLDGGHLFFLLLEKIRGRSLSVRLQERISQGAVFFLILLVVVIFYNDLVRFGIFERVLRVFKH